MHQVQNTTEETFKDLGFGTRIVDPKTRLLNRDGTFNVKRRGLSFFRGLHLYHVLISISTFRFIGIVFLAYFLINCLFAGIYLLIGVEQLNGLKGLGYIDHFWEAFFFSAQTFTTVGYGSIHPSGFAANMVASIESMLGWLAFALATGLVYGRFSRPKAKLLFSDNAIIAPYKDMLAFQFRIANLRKSQLIEVEVQVVMTRVETTSGGGKIRKFYELALERNKVNFLSLSWTIVHPITDTSPMKGWTPQDTHQSDTEYLVLIKGYDDIFNQTIYTRSSYRYNEIIWGAKFENMYDSQEEGITTLHLESINKMQRVELLEVFEPKLAKAENLNKI